MEQHAYFLMSLGATGFDDPRIPSLMAEHNAKEAAAWESRQKAYANKVKNCDHVWEYSFMGRYCDGYCCKCGTHK